MPDKRALTVSAHLLAVPIRFIPYPAPDPVGPVTLDFAGKVVCQGDAVPFGSPF